MIFDILTLFPAMFDAYLEEGVFGRAVTNGLIHVRLTNIRDFAKGNHKTTDDRPYGGGEGMVMKPEPIYGALKSVDRSENGLVVLLSPQGKTFSQADAWELSRFDQIILVCGRYEGVDERIVSGFADREISLGDYVLSGGELGAMVIMDAVGRLIPGVLGGERSNLEDSFEDGLLEYPQYTRPRVFMEMEVPEILMSGDHEKIRQWRRFQALKKTLEKRPDMLERADLSREDKRLLRLVKEKNQD